MLLACGGAGEPPAPAEEEDRAAEGVRFTQEELSHDPAAVRISGELRCDGGGPWRISVWSLRSDERERAPAALPTSQRVTEVTLDAPGPYSLLSIRSARTLIVATAAERTAWADPHGRTMEVVSDIGSLVLDCTISPTPAPDGSQSATQGVRIAPESLATTNVPTGVDKSWLEEVSSAPPINAHRISTRDLGSRQTMSRIRARYKGRLSEDELAVNMIVLYQLIDNPREADAFVDKIVRSRR